LSKNKSILGFSYLKSSWASERKIKDGRAKVPTKVPRPFASVCEIMLNRPAKYLSKNLDIKNQKFKILIEKQNRHFFKYIN
jgi:hypothetical protein